MAKIVSSFQVILFTFSAADCLQFFRCFRYSNGHHSMNNHRQNDDDDALSAMLSRSNRQRTAVYSGKKSTAFYSKDEPLPSLKDMCILILQGIYSTGNLVVP